MVDLHTSGRKDTGWTRRATGIIKFKYRHGRGRRTEGEGRRRGPKEKTRGSKGGDEDRRGRRRSLVRWQKVRMKGTGIIRHRDR